MSDFEGMPNFEDLDPADFSEPTPETRVRLEKVLDQLKLFIPGVTFNPEMIIEAYGIDIALQGANSDDLCPVTQYDYDQAADPLFSLDEETYLRFGILEGDPEKFGNWERVVGDRAIASLYYQDEALDINYHKYFTHDELYITKPLTTELGLFSDDFRDALLQMVNNHMQAYNNGAVKPTEGSMKQLVRVLEQEVAKRLANDNEM